MSCDNTISQRARGFKIQINILDCDSPNPALAEGYDPLDVSSATLITMNTSHHSGTNTSETLILESTGGDGKVYFTTPLDQEYFDAEGEWLIDVVVVFATGTYPGDSKAVVTVVA